MLFKDESVWLNIEKPIGPSSAKIVAIVKKITGAKKVGHGGTLDPFASGILPIALNKATKTSELLMGAKKKYSFRINFGEFRDSDDIEGNVIETSSKRPNSLEIISALPHFIGKIKQKPSRFSAIKINGKRAYELARQNIEFEIKEREVEIFKLNLIHFNQNFCDLEIECSKGTYVRSLARDICKKINICGFVSILTRLSVGNFSYENRISLDLLKLNTSYGGRFLDGALLYNLDVLNQPKMVKSSQD